MDNSQNARKKFNMSLGEKIILIIVAVFVICACLWTVVTFVNFTSNAKKLALDEEISYMETVKQQAKGVEEVCNLASQTISQSTPLIEYIKKVKNGEEISALEKIEFYNTEISAIENITNLNPYLYNIRLYVNADIEERKPTIYDMDRMNNLSWCKTYQNNNWSIDYIDEAFEKKVNYIHLAGLITEIKDGDELLAVLEVSTELENIFINMYNPEDNEYICFIDNEGTIHSSNEQLPEWLGEKEYIQELINDEENMDTSFEIKFENEECIMSTLNMKSMNGTYVHITSVKKVLDSYYSSQIPYLLLVIVSLIFFALIIILLINNLFKRFNKLTSLVSEIEQGNSVTLPEEGNDEISKLAKQINSMVTTLENYNNENMNSELLLKNAEIKSLQNQINAHFMYNVLETIKMMAEIKEDYQISDAVTSLGDMFRYSMQWTSGLVGISEEVNYIKNYLALLNLRFDYEIYLSLNIPEEYMNVQIPKMSLQPIVENSVYHGIENVAEDTSIYLKVYEESGILLIEVTDMGVGMDENKVKDLNAKINSTDDIDEDSNHGRALFNVQQRIKMHFGGEYGLEINSQLGAFTKVTIRIPKDKENS